MTGIFAALRLVPWWAWAGAALLAALGAQTYRLSDAQGDLAREQSARKSDQLRQAERQIEAVLASNKEGDRRVAALQGVLNATQPALDTARAAADLVPDLDRRVRAATAALWACRRSAPADPAAPPGGASTEEAAGVLAELQRRSQEAEGIRNRFADEAAAAGGRCERSYDALKISPGPAVIGAE